MKPDEIVLNQDQFSTLKEIYVERLVDNMSTKDLVQYVTNDIGCLLYTSPSPRDRTRSRMPSSA